MTQPEQAVGNLARHDKDQQAKKEILERIRNANALAGIKSAPAPQREYVRTQELSAAEVREVFIDRLVDYKAVVETCDSQGLAAKLAEIVTGLQESRSIQDIRYAEGLDPELFTHIPAQATPDDRSTDPRDLDRVDLVITDSVISCAQTGTICLQTSPECGRRALTLVPDIHICVVSESKLVYNVIEMIARLDPELPTTMISGPSATSDIELNRVEGVHGPRTLIVVIVKD